MRSAPASASADDRRELQAGGAIGQHRHFIGVDDGVGEAADARDDRHRAIAHRAKLGQAAGLEARGHQNGVGAGLDEMGEALLIAEMDADPPRMVLRRS